MSKKSHRRLDLHSRGLNHRSSRLVQLLGALLLTLAAIAALIFVVIGAADAAPTQIATAIVPQQPYSPGPFDSGQQVDVSIPAGYLPDTTNAYIFECAAPDGVLPTSTTQCDGNTDYGGGTLTTEGNGALDVANDSPLGDLYTIFALPDYYKLGETGTSAANCGLGATRECVLYIGTGGASDTGMAQPHVFSQVFQVHPDPTDSGTVGPGDGTAAVTTSVSATLSTVTPPTQTVTADGADPATVTVTLNDTNSSPVSGKTVTLSPSAGSSTISPASTGSNVTDSNGQATFTVTDSTAETVTYSATDTTDILPINQTAKVTFSHQTVNQSVSSVVANPSMVADDGVTASTVTVTLRDHSVNGSPAPMSGRTVTLSPNGGSSVIKPASSGSNVTNTSGQATFSVTDTVNESVIYTATDTTDSVILSSTASILFGAPLSVSASTSTVVANPSPALTTTGTTVTVTLLAGDGKTPESGKTVSLALQSASGNATISSTNPEVTNSSGQAPFTVTDTTAESVTVTATDATDSLTLAQKLVVVFSAPTAPTLSASMSTVVVSDSPAPADGLTDAVATVTVLNTDGAALSGLTVTMSGNPNTTVNIEPLIGGSGTAPGVTNAQGQTEFTVRDTTAETVTLTATVDGVTLTEQPPAVFVAGTADANKSTVSAAPTQVAADGSTASTVTVTLMDYFGNPISGKTISLTPAAGTSVITPVQVTAGVLPGTTNALGVVQFKVTDSATEVVTYSAIDTSDALALSQLVSVTFGTPPPVLPTMGDSTVVSSASSVVADGKTAAVITVELRDANGDPVTGKSVTLSSSSSTATITAGSSSTASIEARRSESVGQPRAAASPVTAASDSNGNAVFDVTDTAVESVTLTADDTTDSLTGWTVAVSFTTPPPVSTPSGSTTTTTTTASAGAGVGVATTAGSSDGSSGSSSDTGGSTDDGASGTATTDSTTSSSGLAFTGIPTILPWLIGLGLVLLMLGTLGRRALSVRKREQ